MLVVGILTIIICMFLIPFVSADMSLRISGTINNQTSDLWLKVKSGASEDVDVYDLRAPTSPSNYSQFSSAVAGNSLSIYSWGANPRTLNLTYHLSTPQTGTLDLSWDTNSISSDYVVTFKYFGTDSNYTTQVGSDVNMKSSSSYTTTLTGEDSIYIQINVEDYVAPTQAAAATAGGGGGGGIAAEVTDGVTVGTDFMNVRIALDKTTSRKISIYNSGNNIEKINLKTLGLKDILVIDSQYNSFSLEPGQSMEIPIAIIAPIGKGSEGSYKGSIFINKHEVLISIDVSTTELLFDAGIQLTQEYSTITSGGDLKFTVTLIPMGEAGVDVTLN